ncbi:MAG TPA: hypothetical protein VKD90_26845 [Gemmataceae bacterium]|nr:hypothetical protein [Gemmataceae bacterium]
MATRCQTARSLTNAFRDLRHPPDPGVRRGQILLYHESSPGEFDVPPPWPKRDTHRLRAGSRR